MGLVGVGVGDGDEGRWQISVGPPIHGESVWKLQLPLHGKLVKLFAKL